MNKIVEDKEKQIKKKIGEIFDESKSDYISNLNNEQKYQIYTKDVSFIDFLFCLFLFILPVILIHYTIPDKEEVIMQTLFNVFGYLSYFLVFAVLIGICEIPLKKRRMKRLSDFKKIEVLEKKIDEVFMDLPASNIILRKFKENYGSEKLLELLEEKQGNITNREVKEIITEQEEKNKYRDIVDSL